MKQKFEFHVLEQEMAPHYKEEDLSFLEGVVAGFVESPTDGGTCFSRSFSDWAELVSAISQPNVVVYMVLKSPWITSIKMDDRGNIEPVLSDRWIARYYTK
jgi:hypothetical protein